MNMHFLKVCKTVTYTFIVHNKTCNTHSKLPFSAASIKGVLPLLSVECSNSRACVLLSRTYVCMHMYTCVSDMITIAFELYKFSLLNYIATHIAIYRVSCIL